MYPFGYGLSYTDFKWSDFSVARHGNDFVATVTVTNTGDTAGKDQLKAYDYKGAKTYILDAG